MLWTSSSVQELVLSAGMRELIIIIRIAAPLRRVHIATAGHMRRGWHQHRLVLPAQGTITRPAPALAVARSCSDTEDLVRKIHTPNCVAHLQFK